MKNCVTCGNPTTGSTSVNGRFWDGACQTCRDEADAMEDRKLVRLARTLGAVFAPVATMKRDADRRLPVRLAPQLNRAEMRRLRELSDSELALEVAARRLLPVLEAT